MIAADTSTWIAYLAGSAGEDVESLDRALAEGTVVLPRPRDRDFRTFVAASN